MEGDNYINVKSLSLELNRKTTNHKFQRVIHNSFNCSFNFLISKKYWYGAKGEFGGCQGEIDEDEGWGFLISNKR